jgi:hypothetical protein
MKLPSSRIRAFPRHTLMVVCSMVLAGAQSAVADDTGGDGASTVVSPVEGPAVAPADDGKLTEEKLEAMAAKFNNPVADVTLLWFQNDTMLLQGDAVDGTKTANVFAFEPLLSVPINKDKTWLLANRIVIPVLSVPLKQEVGGLIGASRHSIIHDPDLLGALKDPWGRTNGLGDLVFFSLLTPNKGDSGFLWGLGPTFIFDTASEDITGQGKWQAGPAGLAAYLGDPWVLGILAQQWWSFAGDDNRADTNHLNVQYFIQYKLPNMWQVGMTPNITVNWKSRSGQKLSFPIGLGVNKMTILFGKLPVRFGIEGQYFAARPDAASTKWNIRATMIFGLPNPFLN